MMSMARAIVDPEASRLPPQGFVAAEDAAAATVFVTTPPVAEVRRAFRSFLLPHCACLSCSCSCS